MNINEVEIIKIILEIVAVLITLQQTPLLLITAVLSILLYLLLRQNDTENY